MAGQNHPRPPTGATAPQVGHRRRFATDTSPQLFRVLRASQLRARHRAEATTRGEPTPSFVDRPVRVERPRTKGSTTQRPRANVHPAAGTTRRPSEVTTQAALVPRARTPGRRPLVRISRAPGRRPAPRLRQRTTTHSPASSQAHRVEPARAHARAATQACSSSESSSPKPRVLVRCSTVHPLDPTLEVLARGPWPSLQPGHHRVDVHGSPWPPSASARRPAQSSSPRADSRGRQRPPGRAAPGRPARRGARRRRDRLPHGRVAGWL